MLIKEMRESFRHSEDLLDLDLTTSSSDQTQDARQSIQKLTQNATPEQLDLMLEMLHKMDIGNMTGRQSPASAPSCMTT